MSDQIANNKRIAKNTILLYIRMFFTLLVGLYTSRVVLSTLGVSDYGLHNVVGGIITLFTFLNSTLATGTQRFITFSLGKGDTEEARVVFSTAFILHVIFAFIIVVITEVVGLWLLYNKMQIPDGRMTAAFWVFQFSVISTMISIIQVPYTSSIIAHEKMDIYAYMSIYDVCMKLAIVFLIQVLDFDKLILYSFLWMIVHISTSMFQILYSKYKFQESRIVGKINKNTVNEIANFSIWNIFGCGAVALQGQGVNILLNMFFGTVVNAARGIAFQVNGIIMQFVGNFQTAVTPQIVKLYAAGEKNEMIKLVINNSKYAAYLFLLIAIPAFIEIDTLLRLWLGEYPDYTPIFLRIVIIQSLIQTMTRPVVMAIHAVGKMKMVNLTAGSVLLLILPVSYILLKMGATPETVFAVNVIPWVFELFIELFWLNKYIDFPLWGFYKQVYGLVIPLALLMFAIPYIVKLLSGLDGWLALILTGIVSVLSTSIIVYFLGIPQSMRKRVLGFVEAKISQIRNK